MMMIVSNAVRDAINVKLDAALDKCKCPGAALERDLFYQQLLEYFDEHGTLPDFEIKRK